MQTVWLYNLGFFSHSPNWSSATYWATAEQDWQGNGSFGEHHHGW